MTLGEQVVEDYVSMRLTLKAHPLALLRPWLTPEEKGAPPPVPVSDRKAPDLSKISYTRGNPD